MTETKELTGAEMTIVFMSYIWNFKVAEFSYYTDFMAPNCFEVFGTHEGSLGAHFANKWKGYCHTAENGSDALIKTYYAMSRDYQKQMIEYVCTLSK